MDVKLLNWNLEFKKQRYGAEKLFLENRALINQIPNIASTRNHELLTECQVFGVYLEIRSCFLSRISTEQLIGQIEILTNCWCTSFRYIHQIQCFTKRQTKDSKRRQNQKPLCLPSVGTHFFTNCEWLKKKKTPAVHSRNRGCWKSGSVTVVTYSTWMLAGFIFCFNIEATWRQLSGYHCLDKRNPYEALKTEHTDQWTIICHVGTLLPWWVCHVGDNVNISGNDDGCANQSQDSKTWINVV